MMIHRAGGSTAEWAAGTLPYLRGMAGWDSTHPAARHLPARWWRLWNGTLHEEHNCMQGLEGDPRNGNQLGNDSEQAQEAGLDDKIEDD